MSRYIDAEWIRNIYADFEHYENRDDWTTPITNVLAVIEEAPSIDIVRCKECRWATETKMKSIEGDVIYLKTCPSRTEVIDDDDFCSYGERESE